MVLVMGIAGGTGSGKTTFAQAIANQMPSSSVHVLDHDSYYHDLSELPHLERASRNFDEPDALDTDLLCKHVEQLRNGGTIKKPQYDFTKHCRTSDFCELEPRALIIVEGILILTDMRLRSLMDVKFFVDSPDDLRLARRIDRDVQDRGRSVEQIVSQYLTSVRPSHLRYVAPSREFADFVVNGSVGFEKSVSLAVRIAKSFT